MITHCGLEDYGIGESIDTCLSSEALLYNHGNHFSISFVDKTVPWQIFENSNKFSNYFGIHFGVRQI